MIPGMKLLGFRRRPQASGPFAPHLGRRFPNGQDYRTLAPQGAKNNRPWVEYKLHAAQWYLDTLAELHARNGDLNRRIGEEMALDGVTAAGSSAFDSAVAGLIRAMEAHRVTSAAKPVLPWNMSWREAKAIASASPAISLQCQQTVDAALEDDPDAIGWLVQLRRLRNRATHEDSINRMYYVGGEPRASELIVPGADPQAPIPYLTSMVANIRHVCELIMKDADQLNP